MARDARGGAAAAGGGAGWGLRCGGCSTALERSAAPVAGLWAGRALRGSYWRGGWVAGPGRAGAMPWGRGRWCGSAGAFGAGARAGGASQLESALNTPESGSANEAAMRCDRMPSACIDRGMILPRPARARGNAEAGAMPKRKTGSRSTTRQRARGSRQCNTRSHRHQHRARARATALHTPGWREAKLEVEVL
jgi:hypothetical protein